MADYAGSLTLPDHKLGDRWYGLVIGPITFEGAAPVGALTRVRMHFKFGSLVYKLDTDATARDAPIEISNPITWIATIPAIETGFLNAAGLWSWDAEFYRATGGPVTLLKGTIRVNGDVTQ